MSVDAWGPRQSGGRREAPDEADAVAERMAAFLVRGRALLERAQGWVLPPRCVLCLDPGQPPTRDLCVACEAELPWLGAACRRCAEPVRIETGATTSPDLGQACARCLLAPPSFDAASAALRYAWPADAMVRRFKYARQLPVGRVLALLLAERVALDHPAERRLPDCLVPVPLHPERERRRGCNQAWELARVVGGRLGVPVAARGCERVRDTPTQAGLDARARRANLHEAFAIGRLPRGARSVALVDDVLTTGATLGELARVLKAAGVEQVEAWAVARAASP